MRQINLRLTYLLIYLNVLWLARRLNFFGVVPPAVVLRPPCAKLTGLVVYRGQSAG